MPLERAIAGLERDEGLAAQPLHDTARQTLVRVPVDPFLIGGNDLELHRGRATVEHEHVHTFPSATSPTAVSPGGRPLASGP